MLRVKAVQTAVVEEKLEPWRNNCQAEMRAAQVTQFDQARLHQRGKGSGRGPAREFPEGTVAAEFGQT